MKKYCLELFLLLFLFGCSNENNSAKNEKELVNNKNQTIQSPMKWVNVDSIKETRLSPYATIVIEKGKNVIYSGGPSIAWKEIGLLCKVGKMDLVNGPSWLSKLNHDPLTKSDINSRDSICGAVRRGD